MKEKKKAVYLAVIGLEDTYERVNRGLVVIVEGYREGGIAFIQGRRLGGGRGGQLLTHGSLAAHPWLFRTTHPC